MVDFVEIAERPITRLMFSLAACRDDEDRQRFVVRYDPLGGRLPVHEAELILGSFGPEGRLFCLNLLSDSFHIEPLSANQLINVLKLITSSELERASALKVLLEWAGMPSLEVINLADALMHHFNDRDPLGMAYRTLEAYARTLPDLARDEEAKDAHPRAPEIVMFSPVNMRMSRDDYESLRCPQAAVPPPSSITRPDPFQDEVEEDPEAHQPCSICLLNKRAAIVVPCGHACLCGACARNPKVTACPLCRKDATMIIRVFG